jgi:hypothetical protein
METTCQNPADPVLLTIFLAFLGGYFSVSYSMWDIHEPLQIQEKTLTVHDDLLAIDGRHKGDKIAADHEHGFIIGSGDTLLTTADGGVTRQSQNSGAKDHLSASTLSLPSMPSLLARSALCSRRPTAAAIGVLVGWLLDIGGMWKNSRPNIIEPDKGSNQN